MGGAITAGALARIAYLTTAAIAGKAAEVTSSASRNGGAGLA
jgi:hypothetical protein